MHIWVRSSCWSSHGPITDANGKKLEAVGRWIEISNPISVPPLGCHLYLESLVCNYKLLIGTHWSRCFSKYKRFNNADNYHIHCWQFLFCFTFSHLVSFSEILHSEPWSQRDLPSNHVLTAPSWYHLILAEPQFPYPKTLGNIHCESLLLWGLKVVMYVTKQWLRNRDSLLFIINLYSTIFLPYPAIPKIQFQSSKFNSKAQESHVDLSKYFIWRQKRRLWNDF